jgi:hypothetical protein
MLFSVSILLFRTSADFLWTFLNIWPNFMCLDNSGRHKIGPEDSRSQAFSLVVLFRRILFALKTVFNENVEIDKKWMNQFVFLTFSRKEQMPLFSKSFAIELSFTANGSGSLYRNSSHRKFLNEHRSTECHLIESSFDRITV